MTLPRLVLALVAAIFAGLGLAFALAPATMMAAVDIAVPTPLAAGDVRAVYGGMQLAIGALLLAAAARAAWVRAGLLAATALFAGLLAGRLLGVALDGAPSAFGWLLAAAELAGLAISAACARRA